MKYTEYEANFWDELGDALSSVQDTFWDEVASNLCSADGEVVDCVARRGMTQEQLMTRWKAHEIAHRAEGIMNQLAYLYHDIRELQDLGGIAK